LLSKSSDLEREIVKKLVLLVMLGLGLAAGVTAILAPLSSAVAGKQDGPKKPP
jgi:hypothetical protein